MQLPEQLIFAELMIIASLVQSSLQIQICFALTHDTKILFTRDIPKKMFAAFVSVVRQ